MKYADNVIAFKIIREKTLNEEEYSCYGLFIKNITDIIDTIQIYI